MKRSCTAVLLVLVGVGLACAGARPERRDQADAAPALTYKEYTLGALKPAALLIALHYSGSTPEFWEPLLEGWDTPVRVVLPRGPWPRRQGFTWVPADHEQRSEAGKTADIENMAARLAELVRGIRRAHPEIRRVAVTGFSYGGDLAWLLAARYPELIDAAVPMGSRLLGGPAGTSPRMGRVWVLHGEADAIIDARRTRERVEALRASGVPIDVRLYPGLGHDASPELLEDWRTFLQQQLRDTAVEPSPAP